MVVCVHVVRARILCVFINVPTSKYNSIKGNLTLFTVCGPLPPPKAFSRGFFAGVRACFGHNGQRRGSARAVPHALTRGLNVEIYDGYLRYLRGFPAL